MLDIGGKNTGNAAGAMHSALERSFWYSGKRPNVVVSEKTVV
jgi:hypothetical protein